MPRVLIASDDHDLSFARLRELIDDEDLTEMSETLPSDEAKADLLERGIQVSVGSLDQVAAVLEGRVHLGIYLDAVILLTIRPYKNRARLLATAAARLRGLRDDLCFPNGIRAKSLPIVLVDLITLLTGKAGDTAEYEALSGLPWCYIQPGGSTFGQVITRAMGAWRSELLLDLDYVGYGITFNELGEVEVDHVLRRKRRDSAFFDDRATPAGLRSSGYFRLAHDLAGEFIPYRKLEYVLNRVRVLPPSEQEPALQACLDENPVLIRGDLFEQHWSQLALRHPDPLRRDIIPDFILKPRQELAPTLPWEVLEIKTSEEAIIHRGRFTKFFLKALEQVQLHYADYFRTPRTADEQVRKLGQILRKPRMALLIGRKLSDEAADTLSQARDASEWNEVKIISYDDLFETGAQRLALERRIIEEQSQLQ